MVSVVIEKVRIIYKNLIRMGPELNFEVFKARLLERKFRAQERIVPSPEGPLKEYVLTEPKYLRDLVIVSRKGFVVDSRDLNYSLDLINLAYEIYEETMMDYVEYIQTEIAGLYELIVLMKNADKIIMGLHNADKFKKIKEQVGVKDMRPFGVTYAYGVPSAPHEFVVINMVPVATQFGGSSRIKVVINYHGVDPEKGVIFVRNLSEFISKIMSAISL